jgi:hypothetical protein
VTPFLTMAIATMLTDADQDGCATCGFTWDVPAGEARALIDAAPERYRELLARGPDQETSAGWSPSSYVWHVGDVTRAWAERLHTLAHSPGDSWAGFDPDELARARNYAELPVVTAPWALEIAVDALAGVLDGLTPETTFDHPEWGEGSVLDALRWVAHEAVHHQVDVSRGLGRP